MRGVINGKCCITFLGLIDDVKKQLSGKARIALNTAAFGPALG